MNICLGNFGTQRSIFCKGSKSSVSPKFAVIRLIKDVALFNVSSLYGVDSRNKLTLVEPKRQTITLYSNNTQNTVEKRVCW